MQTTITDGTTFETSARSLNDVYIRLLLAIIAAHIMTNYDERETFFEALFSASYWRGFIASFVIATLLICYITRTSRGLDNRFSWLGHTFNRFCWQCMLGVVIPMLLTLLFVSGYFAAFGINILRTEYLKEDYLVAVLMIVCFNLYCFSISQFATAKSLIQNLEAGNGTTQVNDKKHVECIPVKDGKDVRLLPVTEIASIFLVEGNALARTFFGQDFITDLKLDFLESALDARLFFRVNRQLLANRNACKGYVDAGYGKIKIRLDPGCPVDSIVSQRKAAVFKRWFDEYCLMLC